MSKVVSRTIAASCTDGGAALKVSFDATEITSEMKTYLEKRLLKKGVGVRWGEPSSSQELSLRVVEMNQGNQFLRYLLPFIAPAVLEVEGKMAVIGSTPQELHYVQRAQMGLFGGSSKGMLKVCAQRVADKVAHEVVRSLRT